MDASIAGPKAVLYDDVDDVLIVRFTDEPFGWTDGLGLGRQVFYARDGSALAVVVEGASAGVDVAGMPHADLVRTEIAALRRRARRRERAKAA
jgi:hypothetical protein